MCSRAGYLNTACHLPISYIRLLRALSHEMTTGRESTKQPPSTPPGHAGVVGAGIAGLSAAIALRRAGWHVDVFERSQFKNETGAAITVTPNASLVLDRWGFDMAKTEAVPNQSKIIGLANHPLVVIDKQEYANDASKLGHGIWSLHRVDLHRELRRLATMPKMPTLPLAGATAGPPAEIKLGQAVERVECDQGVLELASGHIVTKDLVVIADGAHVSVQKSQEPVSFSLPASANTRPRTEQADLGFYRTARRNPSRRPFHGPLVDPHGRCDGSARPEGNLQPGAAWIHGLD